MASGDDPSGLITSTRSKTLGRAPFGIAGALQLPPMEPEAYRRALRDRAGADADKRLSVYVHLPFCPSRCLTCDNHSNVTHDGREIDRYLDDLDREMRLVTEQLGRRPTLQQLHLGGGTPNYLSDTQLAHLSEIIDRYFYLDDRTEASLEANAHRASRSQLSLLHGLGFRTLNLEIHELDGDVLEAVGRAQSLHVIADVVETARQVGFDTISADLRYGLPRQTAQSITETLRNLLTVAPDRISYAAHSRHQDDFEHQRAVDASQLPSLADKIAMFSRVVDTLCAKDYEWIGLDYFAHRSDRLTQAQKRGELHRNAIGYTDGRQRRVLGFGVNSLSDLSTIRVRNHPDMPRWRESLAAGELPICSGETISPAIRARRDALSDLVCNLHSSDVEQLIGDNSPPAMRALVDDGLVDIGNDRVCLTDSGRFALHHMYGEAATDPQWWDCVA